MPIRYILFDLDETLYPREAGVMQNIGRLIRQFIVDEYSLTPEEADALARRYYLEYGTSMRGLVVNNNLDATRFLAYVHDFPLDILAPSPELDALLASLPGEKIIFTNADAAHAERVLERLGVRQRFSRIVDVVSVGYVSKPNQEAYANCLRLLDAQPEECVLIEDSARNLTPAKQLGMVTVLVDGPADEAADFTIASVLDLGPVIEAICRERACQE